MPYVKFHDITTIGLRKFIIANFHVKQVDIHISKNQVMQILYFKHHVYKMS